MHPRPRAGRYRRALQVVTRRFPSLCIRPRRPPSSPPLVATLIAAAAGRPPSRLAAMIFPFAPSRYAAHNGVRNVIFSLENGRFEAKRTTNLSRGSAPHPVKMTFRLGARPDLRITHKKPKFSSRGCAPAPRPFCKLPPRVYPPLPCSPPSCSLHREALVRPWPLHAALCRGAAGQLSGYGAGRGGVGASAPPATVCVRTGL